MTGSAARSAGRGGVKTCKKPFLPGSAIEPAPAPAPALSTNVPVLSAMRSGALHTRSAAKCPGDLFSVLVCGFYWLTSIGAVRVLLQASTTGVHPLAGERLCFEAYAGAGLHCYSMLEALRSSVSHSRAALILVAVCIAVSVVNAHQASPSNSQIKLRTGSLQPALLPQR